MSVTLTSTDKDINNNANTVFTFQDGDIKSIKVNKTAMLDVNESPGSDSDSTFVVDFNGVNKHIVIDGTITPATSTVTSYATTTSITAQIAWLEFWINGNQSGMTFNSNFQASKKVFIENISYTEEQGNVNFVTFNMSLVESM